MSDFIQTFRENKVAIFFNGGKDSIVLLDLLKNIFDLSQVPVIYVIKENEFPEVEKYVEQITQKYNLNLVRAYDMKDAIHNLVKNQGITHAFTGIRFTDPYGSKTALTQKTDSDWPQITLVNPLLNWSYEDIWSYILNHNLEYCHLYDQGYTSLGQINNTFKNYLLFDQVRKIYLPAYYLPSLTLESNENERIGRIEASLPLTLEGQVIHGNKKGRELGFRTANILIQENIKLPYGVYYGTLDFINNNKKFVMSYGPNIHFDAINKTLELHILDLQVDDFYGKILKFEIKGFIRKMNKFTSLEELVNSIKKDIEIARYNLL